MLEQTYYFPCMFSCIEGGLFPLWFAFYVSVLVVRKRKLFCSLMTITDLFLQQNVRLSLVKIEYKNVITVCFRFAIQRTTIGMKRPNAVSRHNINKQEWVSHPVNDGKIINRPPDYLDKWTVPQLSIMIIYNCKWSILIQWIRDILSGDNLT